MKTKPRVPFLQLFTAGLTIWTVFVYGVLFALRFSNQMLDHQDLVWIVFGPAALLLIGFAAYEVAIHSRHRRH